MPKHDKELAPTLSKARYTKDKTEIKELARHDSERVRLNIARNPNTPVSILTRLAKDSDVSVRAAVFVNVLTSEDVRTKLSSDGVVVDAAARNRSRLDRRNAKVRAKRQRRTQEGKKAATSKVA